MGKVEGYVFGFIAIFLVIVDVVYWYMSHDPTGTTCIALAAGLGGLSGFYLSYTARRTGPRPEDRGDADISEGSGDLAHFSPGSVWPVGMAFSVNTAFLGIIFGLWITFIGAAALLFTLSGLLFEHYRGNNTHTEELVGIDPMGMGGHY
ncbi:MAG TPA: cytochrome c oxidase subunit 4 [Mycobacteriales bacterium]|jgi:hypothetical protein|nr:cytochrome c oxidase subunit 4 [Mycobacteriales bacterium]